MMPRFTAARFTCSCICLAALLFLGSSSGAVARRLARRGRISARSTATSYGAPATLTMSPLGLCHCRSHADHRGRARCYSTGGEPQRERRARRAWGRGHRITFGQAGAGNWSRIMVSRQHGQPESLRRRLRRGPASNAAIEILSSNVQIRDSTIHHSANRGVLLGSVAGWRRPW